MEPLEHECGVALVRLRKPIEYYAQKYGTIHYGLNRLYLLMEKQHNRGQDGAGLAVLKLHAEPGSEYLYREREEGSNAITSIFDTVNKSIAAYSADELSNPEVVAKQVPYVGEFYMGHLRYSTTDRSGLTFIHPLLRRGNWRSKSLALCGNFNLTNVKKVFSEITAMGQHPRFTSDTHVILDQVGHRLDREVEHLLSAAEERGLSGEALTEYTEQNTNLANVLMRTAPSWDGGFVMCGMTGSGSGFALRDRNGLRPAFYYIDEEVIVVASERPVIQTVMNVKAQDVHELLPGQALLISHNADCTLEQILEPGEPRACAFERIYFSRGSDRDIYQERKTLGRLLTEPILKEINYDLEHTVFSYIPNTAEVAYYGMLEGLNQFLNRQKQQQILSLPQPLDPEAVARILNQDVRSEKVAIKDIKLRTFISEGNSRDDLAAHVYDVTYGVVQRGVDNLVVIDDSIVRGTTLKRSILSILDRLDPKKIVVVSSSPQIRYPDYYGINMSNFQEFIAFRTVLTMLRERGMEELIQKAYIQAKQAEANTDLYHFVPNAVKLLYEPFTQEEISRKMADLLRYPNIKAEVSIVYQTLEGLRQAIPNHLGDWYFTGDYPTPGGSHLVNQSFIHFMETEYNAQ